MIIQEEDQDRPYGIAEFDFEASQQDDLSFKVIEFGAFFPTILWIWKIEYSSLNAKLCSWKWMCFFFISLYYHILLIVM